MGTRAVTWLRAAAVSLALLGPSVHAEEFGADWAQVLEDFVDQKVPELTKDYASKDLRKRWLDAYHAPYSRVSNIQDDIVRRLGESAPKREGVASVATAYGILKDLQADIAIARLDRFRLEDVAREITALREACTNDEIVAGRAIASVGGLSIGNIAFSDGPQLIILWDPTWYSTIASLIYDAWALFDDDQKRKRAKAAMGRLPGKIFSPTAAVELSRSVCVETVADRKASMQTYLDSIDVYRGHVKKVETAAWDAYLEWEKYFADAAFTDVLAKAGILEAEVRRAHSLGSAQLLIDLELANNELRGLRTAADRATSCRAGIATVEAYEDALHELDAQVDEYLKVKQLAEVERRLRSVGGLVKQQLVDVPGLFSNAKGRRC